MTNSDIVFPPMSQHINTFLVHKRTPTYLPRMPLRRNQTQIFNCAKRLNRRSMPAPSNLSPAPPKGVPLPLRRRACRQLCPSSAPEQSRATPLPSSPRTVDLTSRTDGTSKYPNYPATKSIPALIGTPCQLFVGPMVPHSSHFSQPPSKPADFEYQPYARQD